MAVNFRSMIEVTGPSLEPLPLYTRRSVDAETASIRSAAPSYRSERPPMYVAPMIDRSINVPSSVGRLPSVPTIRAGGFIGNVESHRYDIQSWSNIRSSGTSKQYENVARRRLAREQSVGGLLQTIPDLALLEQALEAESSRVAVPAAPLLPQEDPELVGESAARAARDARLYREKCMRGEEALHKENKAWDFMLGQMADWREREESWANFRTQVSQGKRVKLAKRIGALQWRR